MIHKFLILICLIVIIYSGSLSSANLMTSGDTLKPQPKYTLTGRVYTGFYYSLNQNVKPVASFQLTGGLFGYSYKFSDKLKVTACYDVTRTTSDISVLDSANRKQTVSFFEGSKYTAYMKQAEIDWQFHKNFELFAGEIFNEQFLTVQDPFWGYRYITYTYQELYKYGNPADFGARLVFKIKNIFKISVSAVNGEGPFKYQDNNSKFLSAVNIEYYPSNFIFKLYANYEPPTYDSSQFKPLTTISAFVAYKCDKFRIGAEYNRVNNYNYIDVNDYQGTSLYSTYVISDKFEVFGRYDYIDGRYDSNSLKSIFTKSNYIIAGGQYQPEKGFFVSLNFRGLWPDDKYQIYVNFGVKF